MAEGVGFEPTVGFPTLDFESSALNRAQPSFLERSLAETEVSSSVSCILAGEARIRSKFSPEK